VATVLPNEKPGLLAFGLDSTSKPGLCKPRYLAQIKYLSSDHIVTWSVRRLCSSSRSFTSRFQICDPTNIHWVAIEIPLISPKMCLDFTATQRISVGSQICKREVKEWLVLYNLCTDHIMIRSELKYLIGAKVAGPVQWNRGPGTTWPNNGGSMSGPGNNPAKTKQFGFRPDLEPNRTEPLPKNRTTGGLPGPVATTRPGAPRLNRCRQPAPELMPSVQWMPLAPTSDNYRVHSFQSDNLLAGFVRSHTSHCCAEFFTPDVYAQNSQHHTDSDPDMVTDEGTSNG